MFEPEQFYGNIEYKLFIGSKKNDRILSQFLFRLREGNGKTIYIIGITDKGQLKNTSVLLLLKSINNFTNIINKYANYKINIFTSKPYVYSIICAYNKNITKLNDVIEYKL